MNLSKSQSELIQASLLWEHIVKLVKDTPNNQELGDLVREFVYLSTIIKA